jgi:predicted nucleic acid-binding protein
VVVRWYVDQDGFAHARRVLDEFLRGDVHLETTDALRIELAHVLRTKGLLKGLLGRAEYLDAVRFVDDAGITVHWTSAERLERSAALAADRNLRFFDALFVDRAIERGLPLLTGDAKLCRAVGGMLSTELLQGMAGGKSAP